MCEYRQAELLDIRREGTRKHKTYKYTCDNKEIRRFGLTCTNDRETRCKYNPDNENKERSDNTSKVIIEDKKCEHRYVEKRLSEKRPVTKLDAIGPRCNLRLRTPRHQNCDNVHGTHNNCWRALKK